MVYRLPHWPLSHTAAAVRMGLSQSSRHTPLHIAAVMAARRLSRLCPVHSTSALRSHPVQCRDDVIKHRVWLRQARRELRTGSHTHTMADDCNVDSITVGAEYRGPRWEEGDMDREFIGHLLHWFSQGGLLHYKYACKIVLEAKRVLKTLPTLVDVSIPEGGRLTVCGDTHGQFSDLQYILSANGSPSPDNSYLFNGDFVDRGPNSVEVILSLLALKILHPHSFHLARGNHETDAMNVHFGFHHELQAKYSRDMCRLFSSAFNWLPLAHLVGDRVLVLHGGLSAHEGLTLQDIADSQRNRQPPHRGVMCDVLWSDPRPQPGLAPSPRGAGVHFGPDVTHSFCSRNGLDVVIRSHECKEEGYDVQHDGKCITIFSASNYCGLGNKGAFMTLSRDLRPSFTTFYV